MSSNKPGKEIRTAEEIIEKHIPKAAWTDTPRKRALLAMEEYASQFRDKEVVEPAAEQSSEPLATLASTSGNSMGQRELKFRAVCDADDTQRMVYFGMTEFDNGIASWPMPDNIAHIDEYLSPLMQFTGLKDKNGIDIYEGDIVDFSFDGVLFIRCGTYVVFEKCGFLIHKKGFSPLLSDASFISVIGNIYQHPHLLSQPSSSPTQIEQE